MVSSVLYRVCSFYSKGNKDAISYREVSQDEIELKRGLSQEETIFSIESVQQRLKIIRDKSLPKPVRGRADQVRLLYLPSYSSYPNAEHILALVKRSRVTETELTIQHIEMLLEVLILNGKVEEIPAFVQFNQSDASENSDSDTSRSSTGKRRRKSRARNTDESASSDDGQPRKKRRRQRDSALATSDDDVNDGSCRQRKKRGRDDMDSDACNTPDDDADLSENDKPRRKRHRLDKQCVSRSGQDGRPRGKRKGRAYSASGDSHDFPGSTQALADLGRPDACGDAGYSSGFVYRPVHEERIVLGLGQSPCVRCPTGDFCGPVNAQECVYYETWLAGDVVSVVEEAP
ncbi:hypothetical protein DAEQUDRAFT_765892 [Daedalea quercina L-15889]|uniref:Uncharacterized protein n=1 Tax=Daedalea quercina L-15889 TaxID=1314783 RepID=A0A165Q181_9APHY|nr:hypothetical protein DAEQUDRAFT_765892 [Daedalea quercina L-15889]